MADASLNGNLCSLTGRGRELCVAAQGGCIASRCGDGFADTGADLPEACDDGEANAEGWALARLCNSLCTAYSPYCGDGIVNGPESCDDDNTVDDNNDCSPTCTCVGVACSTPEWVGLAGSDFGPRSVSMNWGSQATNGLPLSEEMDWIKSPSVVRGADGRLFVAWEASFHWDYPDIYVTEYHDGRWTELGVGSMRDKGVSQTSDASEAPVLVIDSSGNPVVAWQDYNWNPVEQEIYVRRFDGARWIEMGLGSAEKSGISTLSGDACTPTMVLASDGRVVVAWDQDGEIFVKQFDGSNWIEVGSGSAAAGGVSNSTTYSSTPTLGVSPAGELVLVWEEWLANTNAEIYVKRFDGSAWVAYGVGAASGGGISNSPVNSIDPVLAWYSGAPVVAWYESGGSQSRVYVRTFDGAAWVELGVGSASGAGVNDAGTYGARPTLGTTAAGELSVAWLNMGWSCCIIEGTVFARKWNGIAWVDMGSSSAGGTGISKATWADSIHAVLNAENQPTVVYSEGGLYAVAFDGTAWRELPGTAHVGGFGSDTSDAVRPTLLLDANGWPLIFWEEGSPAPDIHGSRFDGTAWAGLGLAGDTNISNTAGISEEPVAVLDTQGRVVLAWDEEVGTEGWKVFVKRWSAGVWDELGGSATGDGVSGAFNSAFRPALALLGNDQPVVVWEDENIVAKVWRDPLWEPLDGAEGDGIIAVGHAPTVVAMDATRLAFAWENLNADISGVMWTGSAWAELSPGAFDPGITKTGGTSTDPQLVLDDHQRLVLVWSDEILHAAEIHAWVLEDRAWHELSSPDLPFGNVSDTADASITPVLALDDRHRPIVAWADNSTSNANAEIYVRRYNGQRWVELGSGSALGGGISNSTCVSANPAIATSVGRVCVAWNECAAEGQKVVSRCATW